MLSMLSNLARFRFYFICLIALWATSCGGDGDDNAPASSKSAFQRSLEAQASKQNIPPRFALAIGYLESRLSPKPSKALYINSETGVKDGTKGLPMAETAFGISALDLKLEGNPKKEDLKEQFKAYSTWLRSSINEAGLNLPSNPKSVEDIVTWVFEVSQFHRRGTRVRAEVRIVFSRELIKILNSGFYWQGDNADESVRLAPASPQIEPEQMTQNLREYFELNMTAFTDIPNVEFLQLDTLIGEEGNRPDHVEVIHCPMSLSSCLAIQNQTSEGDIKMEAHYIVPATSDIIAGPIQIARHVRAVRLTDQQGNQRLVDNAIVIMLVGNSGRLEDGYRVDANPQWLSKQQIIGLTSIVNSICQVFVRDGTSSYDTCMSLPVGRPRLEREILFQTPVDASYRWGDVPDFDARIFSNYFLNPGTKLEGAATFEKSNYESLAGARLDVKLDFTSKVRTVVFERLVSCPDRSLEWTKVSEDQIRDVTNFSYSTRLWDSGPNQNGTHYLRAKVYGGGKLIGWDTAEVFIKDFDLESNSDIVPEVCTGGS